jgi:SAM-dependent methyltransferase
MKFKKYEKRRQKLIANSVKGNTVLDIGHAQMPNEYLSNFHSIGYDKNKPKNKTNAYKKHIQGDISEITKKLANQKFDTIICAELLEHLENPYQFLRELHTLLKKEGALIISTPNPLGFPILFFELFQNKKRFYSNDHTYYFLPRWVERLLDLTGYKLEQIKPVGIWCGFFFIACAIKSLSYQLIYIAEKID